MRKIKLLIALCLLAFLVLLLFTFNDAKVSAEELDEPIDDPVDEPIDEPVEEVYECKVIVEEIAHGKVKVDKNEGHVGDIVTIDVNPDLLYLIENISVNGVALVESETTKGLYKFALVEGNNTITGSIVVNRELLGELAVVYDQARSKDWTNLFSVDNVLRIISWLLSGGVLFAVIRYVIRDKRLAEKLENRVNLSMQKILPEASKKIILENMQELITPFFEKILGELKLNIEDIGNAMTVFSRCFALSLENTPESRIAITQELSSLKLSDQATISVVQEQMKKLMEEQNARMEALMEKMDKIEATNKKIIEETEKPVEEEQGEVVVKDNGIQI